jgi:hypothetical protein
VITLTAEKNRAAHPAISMVASMPASNWQLNRFERILFWTALTLGGVVIAIRLGAILVVWYVHNFR